MYARVIDIIGISGVTILSASIGIVWSVIHEESEGYKRAIGA